MPSSNEHPSGSSSPEPRRNQQITSRTVRLIAQDGKDLGIVKTDEARQAARSAGLDVVEVAPHARPPVCKIFGYEAWVKIQGN